MSDLWPCIYTRISHDLSGLAGSIFNGTELLVDEPTTDMALMLQKATGQLVARLKFFRQTFGQQNKLDEDTTAAYLETLSVPVRLEGVCSCALERVLCMALADTLPRGGCIRVQKGKLTAEGQTIKLLPCLEKGTDEESPQTAAALYAYELAKQQQIRLVVEKTETSVCVRLNP